MAEDRESRKTVVPRQYGRVPPSLPVVAILEGAAPPQLPATKVIVEAIQPVKKQPDSQAKK